MINSLFMMPKSASIGRSVLFMFAVAMAMPLCGNDWPIFRSDPALTGAFSRDFGLPVRLRWRHSAPGGINGSPVIVAGKVFFGSGPVSGTGSASGSSAGSIKAIALATGSLIWTYHTNSPVESSPLFAAGRIYAGDVDGMMHALDADSGQRLWSFQAGGRITGSANWFSIPAAGSGFIVFGCYDNFLYCLSATDGRLHWKMETGSFIHGTAAVTTMIVPQTTGGGQTEPFIVLGSCDNLLRLIRGSDGTVVATYDSGSYIAGSPALYKGIAYFGNYSNKFIAVDLQGMKQLWNYSNRPGSPFLSSPAITETHLFVGSRDRRMYALDRLTGAVLWTFVTGGEIDGSPVALGNTLIFGSGDGWIHLVDAGSGRALWAYDLGSPVLSSPAMSLRMVVVATADGVLHGFEGR
jgi:outer membrane protein assembly factor BamB